MNGDIIFCWLEVLTYCEEIASNCSEVFHQFNNFFFRYPLDLPPRMVDDVYDGFVYTAKMIAKYGSKNKVKNLTRDCSWCSYRDICYAEMTGGDVEYTIEKNYTTKPEDTVEPAAEAE